MGELGGFQKYLYWSERRIIRWLEDSNVQVPKPTQQKLTTPNFSNLAPTIEISSSPREATKPKIAEVFTRSLGRRIVSDFDSPPPIEFAQSIGSMLYGQFIVGDTPTRALMYSSVETENYERVAVCLFGSMENLADFISDSEPARKGWTTSSAGDIERFLQTREIENGLLLDSVEDLAREAVKVACHQGVANPTKKDGYNRGFTYGETRDVAEWCAEIYWDVNLKDTSEGPEEGHTRVLIGAPLWIRTPSLRSIHLYSEYTKQEWQSSSQDPEPSPQAPFLERLRAALRIMRG